jgi:hypothetical protein
VGQDTASKAQPRFIHKRWAQPFLKMDELTIERINNERQRYVDFFVKAINTLKGDKDTFASELPIKVNDQSIPEPFDIIRVDFIYKKENGKNAISEIRLDNNLKYDKLNFKVNDL